MEIQELTNSKVNIQFYVEREEIICRDLEYDDDNTVKYDIRHANIPKVWQEIRKMFNSTTNIIDILNIFDNNMAKV